MIRTTADHYWEENKEGQLKGISKEDFIRGYRAMVDKESTSLHWNNDGTIRAAENDWEKSYGFTQINTLSHKSYDVERLKLDPLYNLEVGAGLWGGAVSHAKSIYDGLGDRVSFKTMDINLGIKRFTDGFDVDKKTINLMSSAYAYYNTPGMMMAKVNDKVLSQSPYYQKGYDNKTYYMDAFFRPYVPLKYHPGGSDSEYAKIDKEYLEIWKKYK